MLPALLLKVNQGGFASLERYSDFVCVNGHAYHDRKSSNTNFAFLENRQGPENQIGGDGAV